jgi:hypothetical protein
MILASLPGIAVFFWLQQPRYEGCDLRSKDASLKSDLKIYRSAIDIFRKDTGARPRDLADLSAIQAPRHGVLGSKVLSIKASDWKGPYIDAVMTDPQSGKPFLYDPRTGQVYSSAGPPYDTW